MTAVSPFSVLKDANPAALAGRAISAAVDLAGDARAATKGKSFGDLIDGLDANGNGRLGIDDAIGLASRGAAKVVSAFTGVDIDTRGVQARTAELIETGRDAASAHMTQDAAPPAPPTLEQIPRAPVPPTVEGIHQLYDRMRALRS